MLGSPTPNGSRHLRMIPCCRLVVLMEATDDRATSQQECLAASSGCLDEKFGC